jgi:outer membrane murein-binding lipoprotein Lpp
MAAWVQSNAEAALTLVTVCVGLVLGLLNWSLTRNVTALDSDVRNLKEKDDNLQHDIESIKLEWARAEGEAATAREHQRRHMEREEKDFWPKVDALRDQLERFQRDDISQHSVIGERLARLETLLNGRH